MASSDCTIKRTGKNKENSYSIYYKGEYTDYTEVLKAVNSLDKYLHGECIPSDIKEFIDNITDILEEVDEEELKVSIESAYQKEEASFKAKELKSFNGLYIFQGKTYTASYNDKEKDFDFKSSNDLPSENEISSNINVYATIYKKITYLSGRKPLEKENNKTIVKERGIN